MPTTPTNEVLESTSPKDPTSLRARIKGIIEYLEATGRKGEKSNVFRHAGVSRAQGYRLLASENPGHLQNDSNRRETRGRKKIITSDQLKEMEYILETEGLETRGLTWEQLGREVGSEASGRTIQRILGSQNFHQCIACQRSWQSPASAKNRVDYAKYMLGKYPEPEDWYKVRFSYEINFGLGPGPQHQLRMIRKPGERYCFDCMQHFDEPSVKDEKRFHCWAAVGYNFRSNIHFYDLPTSKHGKMSQEIYINQILEPIVKPWLLAGENFVLEEDGDSGHGPKGRNIVKAWKRANGLEHFFNCASSPDLSPIENCWQPPNQHLNEHLQWDETTAKTLIYDGWNLMSQTIINERIRSMPRRLQDVIDSGGKMTGY